jgi:hypothetical protein
MLRKRARLQTSRAVPLRVKIQGNNHFPGPHHANTSASCHNDHSFAGISAGRHSSGHSLRYRGLLNIFTPAVHDDSEDVQLLY